MRHLFLYTLEEFELHRKGRINVFFNDPYCEIHVTKHTSGDPRPKFDERVLLENSLLVKAAKVSYRELRGFVLG